MSIKAVEWVFAHSEATLGARLVMLALADYAHDDGSNAFPSLSTVAAKTRMSVRQVRRCLRDLEESGEIEATGVHDSGTVIYRVSMRGDNMTPPDISVADRSEMSAEPLEPLLPLSESVRSGSVEEDPALTDEPEARTTTSGGAQEMTAAFVDRYVALTGYPPAARVTGAVAQQAGQLARGGTTLAEFEAGVELMLQKQKVAPALLPQFVDEARLPSQALTNGARFGRGMTVASAIASTQRALEEGR